MKSVFVLQHSYERPVGIDESKFIGVYATRAKADAAVKRLMIQPGFRDHPDEFCIDEYELNQDHWGEVFV